MREAYLASLHTRLPLDTPFQTSHPSNTTIFSGLGGDLLSLSPSLPAQPYVFLKLPSHPSLRCHLLLVSMTAPHIQITNFSTFITAWSVESWTILVWCHIFILTLVGA